MLSWTIRRALDMNDPTQAALFPMTKAFYQCMKAAQEFIIQNDFGDISAGWIAAGASKRGWTTWLVGGVTCESCIKLAGIVPLVPIVPSLQAELHR